MTAHSTRNTIIGAIILGAVVALFVWNRTEAPAPAPRDGTDTASPVEEDVRVTYTDGTIKVPATYRQTDDTVTFTHPTVGTLTLPVAVSGSGARYASPDERIVFWEHQGVLTITRDGITIFEGALGASAESTLREADARAIGARVCITGDESLGPGTYNAVTKTWWFDASLNEMAKGCNPACVVSEETGTAELNWRCTGLIPRSE